jgi:DNA polymerase III alpha subunit (gram-positive type)
VANLIFLDTETTGLSPATGGEIWEFAAITRLNGQPDQEFQFFVDHDLSRAASLPEQFRADHDARYDHAAAIGKADLVEWLSDQCGDYTGDQKVHIVGAMTWFDIEFLTVMFRELGVKVPWHYHLIDVENLAIGFGMGCQKEAYKWGNVTSQELEGVVLVDEPPWDSHVLSRSIGVFDVPSEKHTALGDTRWARDVYDRVMASAS